MRFLVPWTLQGLWIFLTANVVIVVNSQSGPSPPLGIWDGIGLAIWILGFWIEVLADSQKTRFNSNPKNEGRWIDQGLWSLCRLPYFLGETLLGTGIAVFGVSCLEGFEWVSWISPEFIYLILTKVRDIHILERSALS